MRNIRHHIYLVFTAIYAVLTVSSALIKPARADSEEFYTGCEPGYYINPATGRCNKIKVCKTGYQYDAVTNSCRKLTCPFGYKISEADNLCYPLVCDEGFIHSLATGNCVKIPASFEGCPAGEAYDGSSKTCQPIFPESDLSCKDEEYLNRASSECISITNLSDYEEWTSNELVSTNDSTSITNGSLLLKTDEGDSLGLNPLGVAETASSSGYTADLADINSPEYAELRAIILAYFEEQASLNLEEAPTEDASDPDTEKPVTEKPDENQDNNGTATEETAEESTQKTCPEGKVLNPATGRCKTLVTVSETSTSITTSTFNPETGETTTVKTCIDGYTLNPETNRCVKDSSGSTGSTTKTCPEGQFLNPATNRCKNLSTTTTTSTSKTVTTYDPVTGEATTVKTCIEGYELNPDTNRCVKVKNNEAADYSLDVPTLGEIESSPKVFIAVAVVVAIVLIGVGVVIFQFRHDIAKIFHKVLKK